MTDLEFKEKQFDGPYEVSEIQINNEGQIFRGFLYFPPERFNKPYPVIIYFHGFPHLFTLKEIVKKYNFLLNLGYSLIVFNFRGYRFSEGKVSIRNQVSDGIKLIEFVDLMAKNEIFNLKEVSIIGYEFGAYIALILCSKVKIINKLLLINPVLDIRRHVYSENFLKILNYINRFLPGNIHGIENIEQFVKFTKKELENQEFQIENVIHQIKCKKLKIIIREVNTINYISEVKRIVKNLIKINIETKVSKNIDNNICFEEDSKIFNHEVELFFSLNSFLS
ncbi:MAG: alpha/beta hydrolase family protein [Promethearchaeota archaeon]